MIINECFNKEGEVRKVNKHKNFRIILSFCSKRGKIDISGPLINRCLYYNYERIEN